MSSKNGLNIPFLHFCQINYKDMIWACDYHHSIIFKIDWSINWLANLLVNWQITSSCMHQNNEMDKVQR